MMYFEEKSTKRQAQQLQTFPYYQAGEPHHLLEYLDNQSTFIISDTDLQHHFQPLTQTWTTQAKLQLYFSLFQGRRDVYAKSYLNSEGKIQYYPSYTYGWKTLPPDKRQTQPLTEEVLKSHLRGECRIGLFPISLEDSCSFLALDFDKADWQASISDLRKIAKRHQLDLAVEISRSGQGGHIWLFFQSSIPCQQARKFGKKLLDLALQESSNLSFESFDRMFPNQDFLPKGGFGNLIALPLQGQSYQEGKTVFVDEKFHPYPSQWDYLASLEKISPQTVQDFLDLEQGEIDLDDRLEVTLSHSLIFEKVQLSPATIYHLKKLASFANPEFYLKQASRQPTYQTPERIYLYQESDGQLQLPRGLLSKVQEDFAELVLMDERSQKANIKVSFTGQLTFAQELALSDLLTADNGILRAETGFGKTVLGAALIAQRKKPAAILVHNRQLLNQWLDRLGSFLTFEEEEVYRYTASGRKKKLGHLGQYMATKKWRSGLVDIIMIQSLFKNPDIAGVLSDYDLLLVDECHHVPALQFEKVISQFSGTYLYGLTATPERKNGHEPILFQRIGPILHQADQQETAFSRQLSLKLTNFGKFDQEISQSTNFSQLCDFLAKNEERNQSLVADIRERLEAGRKMLLLSNRLEQLDLLEEGLADCGYPVYKVSGKTKKQESQQLLENLEKLETNQAFVLLSTGKYVGEGFDLPRLDSLILASPLSWKNNLIQYAGRIHRPCEGKDRVEILDYLDLQVPYLEKMFHKRQVAYKKMGYQVIQSQGQQSLYSSKDYLEPFLKEVAEARDEIVIYTPYVTISWLKKILAINERAIVKLYLSKSANQNSLIQDLLGMRGSLYLMDKTSLTNFVSLDGVNLWYGNFFSKSETTILRLSGQGILKEFYQYLETNTNTNDNS